MQILGASECGEFWKSVEDVQRFADCDSTGGRGRHRQQRVITEASRYGLAPDRFVACEILERNEPASIRCASLWRDARWAAALHLVHDELRDFALVKTIGAFARNGLRASSRDRAGRDAFPPRWLSIRKKNIGAGIPAQNSSLCPQSIARARSRRRSLRSRA